MPFRIIRNNITKVKADAIVNTANPKPRVGSGTDSAVYAAAGERKLLEARRKIGDIAPGQARSTDAFKLDAKYIIHTVGPAWVDGAHGEREVLRACYANTLALAADLSCESIAFPLISSGAYGFPKDEALNIALSEIGKFLLTHEMQVILVVFDRKALQLSERLVGDIAAYIDDHDAERLHAAEYGPDRRNSAWHRERRERVYRESVRLEREEGEAPAFEEPLSSVDFPAPAGKSLEELLDGKSETFQQRLLKLIDQSGMTDVTVYKKANVDRKLFSRIRCKADYRPKKKTALAFAIALELDLPTTRDLLARAELALSPSSRFDLIVSYFITHKNYDIFEINATLFKYDQPILGESPVQAIQRHRPCYTDTMMHRCVQIQRQFCCLQLSLSSQKI